MHTHTPAKPTAGKAGICWVPDFPVLHTCEAAAHGMCCPQLPSQTLQLLPHRYRQELQVGITGRSHSIAATPVPFPECVGDTGRWHFSLWPSLCAHCGHGMLTLGQMFRCPERQEATNSQNNAGSSFSVWRHGDQSQNQHTKTELNMHKWFDVTAKLAPSLFLSPDYPEIFAHKGREKIPWLYRTSQPLIYVQAEWYIRVKVGVGFQNWSNKLFYWYLFPIYGSFLMI